MNDENDEPVKSVTEYLERIKDLPKDKSTKYAFRGQGNESDPVSSSAARRLDIKSNSPEMQQKHIDYNKDLVTKAVMKGYHQKGSIQLNQLELLAELQHNGAATCLIDFSLSALVALYFACTNENGKNGAVHIINQNDGQQYNKITPEEMKEEKLEILFYNEEDKLWIWEPSDLNNRIPKQHSIFVFGKPLIESDFSIKIDKNSKKELLNELKEIHDIEDLTLFSDLPGFAKANSCDKVYYKDDPFEKGIAEFQRKNYLEAIRFLNSAENFENKNFMFYFYRGNSYLGSKNYKDAIKDFEKAININPEYPYSYINRGIIESKLGQYEEAIQDFNKAIELGETNARTYYNRGITKSESGSYQDAISDLNEALKLSPNLEEAYYARGNAKSGLGNYEEAVKDYDLEIEINPNFPKVYNNRGISKFNLGLYEEAIKDFDKAIELDSHLAEAYSNRGRAKLKLGKYNEAIQDFNKAIELNPNLAGVYSNRGNIKLILSRYEEAIQDFDKAIKLEPKLSETYNNRGYAKLKLGKYKEAIVDFNKAIELNPNLTGAYKNIEEAKRKLEEEGDDDK